MKFSKTLAIGLLALSATQALADAHGNKFAHSREFNGQTYMMYQTHMSLYYFTNDEIGVSNCNGACAEAWPPAVFPEGTPMGENYSLIQRDDGRFQVAFKGHPLYLYSGDTRIGETNGDGVDGLWRLARPELF